MAGFVHADLMAGRPRQGTLQRWRQAGRAIERLVDGDEGTLSPIPWLDSLLPRQQEVMCSEFLASPMATDLGVPRLAITYCL